MLCAGLGVDQIGEPFGLCKVEFVVQKRAAREFPRLGKAQAGAVGQCLQRSAYDGDAAMQMQLHHVFAGEGMRCFKIQHQGLVDRRAAMRERCQGRHAWRGCGGDAQMRQRRARSGA